jgi:hypothetical protein
MIEKCTIYRLVLATAIGMSLWACNQESKIDPVGTQTKAEPVMTTDDSLREAKINSLIENVSEITIDKQTKCNLTKGYYVLKSAAIDTSDLQLLTKHLASQLFQSIKKDPMCDYSIMSQAFVYLNMDEYEDYTGNWVSMCSITPSNYSGDVSIQPHKLKLLKH